MLLNQNRPLRPVVKILTDYPRDDLAHDEVQQALVTACVAHGLSPQNIDVGALPGMDTVVAGFKTAQLAMNSQLGYGHIIHTNCAPRTHMASVKSRGEKVVLGMTPDGVAMLVVNSGLALAPFYTLAETGGVVFYQTDIPDAGSQFRSRDFFPDALARLGAHLAAQADALGAEAVRACLARRDFDTLLAGLSYLGPRLDMAAVPSLPQGMVMYVDNFGNIKMNIRHADLLAHYDKGDVLAVRLGGFVCDATLGAEGFSQGEGLLALTSGSSGWVENGERRFFTEIMLRGGRASNAFGGVAPGEKAILLRESDLQQVVALLREADRETIERLDLHNTDEARVISMLARKGLIKNGYDTTALRAALAAGDLLQRL